jgi:histidinol dehydrogenase
VREEGDKAVVALEEKFDKVRLSSLQVTDAEIAEAEAVCQRRTQESYPL